MVRADIFCRVVDNFGDAGVCWRLARRLARDHALRVRLWIDRPDTLLRFVEPSDDDRALLASGRIHVHAWTGEDFGRPAELVIETFGCDLPARYAADLAGRPSPAHWYNLEYLSAEDWVEGCHGLPSPHPRLPVSRTFFFPGFTAATGGLLREPGLLARRDAVRDAAKAGANTAGATVQATVGGDLSRGAGATPVVIGVFCYPDAPLPALLDALALHPRPARVRLFQGAAQALAQAWVAQHPGHRLEFEWLPWMGQDDFDRILWTCDFNIVRGEDSFVRAQWAGRPLVWDIYPQADGAHLVKMAAFLRRYRDGMAPAAAEALGALWQPWVRREPEGIAAAWEQLEARLPALCGHAETWCRRLAAGPDLADALLAHAGMLRAKPGPG